MISLQHLTFAYPGQPAIFQDFDWHAAPGEMWAVIGPSGCGKSTLLYLIAGLRQPINGGVRVAGAPVTRPRASTGLILQDYGLLPWATVWENVALGMRLGQFYAGKRETGPARPYPPSDISPASVDHWLERLGIARLRHAYPSQLSGGATSAVGDRTHVGDRAKSLAHG
jgi:NitT/TauT family transport system ATP-binding protein